jgi:hypothetical protein
MDKFQNKTLRLQKIDGKTKDSELNAKKHSAMELRKAVRAPALAVPVCMIVSMTTSLSIMISKAIGFRFLPSSRDISPLYNNHNCSGAHSASYPTGTNGLRLVKMAGLLYQVPV